MVSQSKSRFCPMVMPFCVSSFARSAMSMLDVDEVMQSAKSTLGCCCAMIWSFAFTSSASCARCCSSSIHFCARWMGSVSW